MISGTCRMIDAYTEFYEKIMVDRNYAEYHQLIVSPQALLRLFDSDNELDTMKCAGVDNWENPAHVTNLVRNYEKWGKLTEEQRIAYEARDWETDEIGAEYQPDIDEVFNV